MQKGKERWIYPIMESVIVGIKNGDKACIELGVEFLDEFQEYAKLLRCIGLGNWWPTIFNCMLQPANKQARILPADSSIFPKGS
jgi:hypothetical protein